MIPDYQDFDCDDEDLSPGWKVVAALCWAIPMVALVIVLCWFFTRR